MEEIQIRPRSSFNEYKQIHTRKKTHSSFFIEILMLAFYGPKCKKAKINFGKKSLNVHNVKQFLKKFSRFFGVFVVLFYFKL